ncbi:hypothetical protein KM043_004021 [Ampulex compressa]|nr:hypothetical protein KM043_004021 [Ampulex compressa]
MEESPVTGRKNPNHEFEPSSFDSSRYQCRWVRARRNKRASDRAEKREGKTCWPGSSRGINSGRDRPSRGHGGGYPRLEHVNKGKRTRTRTRTRWRQRRVREARKISRGGSREEAVGIAGGRERRYFAEDEGEHGRGTSKGGLEGKQGVGGEEEKRLERRGGGCAVVYTEPRDLAAQIAG